MMSRRVHEGTRTRTGQETCDVPRRRLLWYKKHVIRGVRVLGAARLGLARGPSHGKRRHHLSLRRFNSPRAPAARCAIKHRRPISLACFFVFWYLSGCLAVWGFSLLIFRYRWTATRMITGPGNAACQSCTDRHLCSIPNTVT
jgi:hypothetical protein